MNSFNIWFGLGVHRRVIWVFTCVSTQATSRTLALCVRSGSQWAVRWWTTCALTLRRSHSSVSSAVTRSLSQATSSHISSATLRPRCSTANTAITAPTARNCSSNMWPSTAQTQPIQPTHCLPMTSRMIKSE